MEDATLLRPDQEIDLDRRSDHQPPERHIGRIISCDGSRATIATERVKMEGVKGDWWSIGRLISINLGPTRVVGLVYGMQTNDGRWADVDGNVINIHIELVGEIYTLPNGRDRFRKGVTNYPYIGAVVHRIRGADLKVMHDLGDDPTAVHMGVITQDETVPASVSVDMMLKRHFAVVGSTGVGKSSAVSALVRNAIKVKPNLRVVILDPHNEYAAAFPECSITLDSSSLELPFWMLRYDEFADIVFRGYSGTDEENEILRDMVGAARTRYAQATSSQNSALSSTSSLLKKSSDSNVGPISADNPSPYRMIDLFQIIEEFIGKLDQRYSRYHLRTVKSRLEALHADFRYRFMFGKTAIEDNIQQVISKIYRIPHENRPITVFQLAGLPSDVVNAVASVLSRMAFEVAMLSGGSYEVLLLCEEAHRYVPQAGDGFAPTRYAIARIAKEGRKYGCYLGVITQRPGELDPTILSQCSTVFTMRLSNDRDQEIIRSAIADSSASTISFLSSLGNREAIAFGEGVATTMRMRFDQIARHALPQTAFQAALENGAAMQDPDLRHIVGKMRSAP
jgi:uncharacterized protein